MTGVTSPARRDTFHIQTDLSTRPESFICPVRGTAASAGSLLWDSFFELARKSRRARMPFIRTNSASSSHVKVTPCSSLVGFRNFAQVVVLFFPGVVFHTSVLLTENAHIAAFSNLRRTDHRIKRCICPLTLRRSKL